VLQLLVTANVVPSSLILSIKLVFLRSVLQLLVTANAVPSSLILSTLIMGAILSSEPSPPTRATQHHIPEDGILNSHYRDNLKCYRDVLANLFSYITCCFKDIYDLLDMLDCYQRGNNSHSTYFVSNICGYGNLLLINIP
jgi:hypothetical protein